MIQGEDTPPVLKANQWAPHILRRCSDAKEVTQCQELSIERVPRALVGQGCSKHRPIQLMLFRQPCQIIKVAKVGPSAPVVRLLDEIMHDPVEGPRLWGGDFRPKAVTAGKPRGLAVNLPVRPELQETDVLRARHATRDRHFGIAKLGKASPGSPFFGRFHSQVEIAHDPVGNPAARRKEQGNGPFEQDRNDAPLIEGSNGFIQLLRKRKLRSRLQR